MSTETVLETDRMTLRRMTMEDVDPLMDIFSDPEAMRYYPGTKSRAEAEGWVQWNLRLYEGYGHGLWIATLKETLEFAGQCGLVVQTVDGVKEVELGYLFLRRFWGQGLATEAALACRDYAFETLGRSRIVSLIDPGNAASRRVAEKVGMDLEREIVKWDKPICVYAMSADGAKP
jgi:ribosomal-protein-alanine N-acetyltransferase